MDHCWFITMNFINSVRKCLGIFPSAKSLDLYSVKKGAPELFTQNSEWFIKSNQFSRFKHNGHITFWAQHCTLRFSSFPSLLPKAFHVHEYHIFTELTYRQHKDKHRDSTHVMTGRQAIQILLVHKTMSYYIVV